MWDPYLRCLILFCLLLNTAISVPSCFVFLWVCNGSNALKTYKMAMDFIPTEINVIKLIKKFIVKSNFLEICKISNGFQGLSLVYLEGLVKDDNLGNYFENVSLGGRPNTVHAR